MTLSLEQRFPEELSVLEDLFGYAEVQGKLPRLNDIHDYTEAKWRNYVAKLPDGRVNYLLIAEAPPWSDTGATPQYVLDPASRPRTLMRALRKTFPSAHGQLTPDEVLGGFAKQGFLIVDSIPFAMDYSSKRAKPKYEKLVRLTVRTYLQETINLSSLSWSGDVRIAFSVKLNALAVMKALGAELNLNGRRFAVSPESIAVNRAGYPDWEKLRALYGVLREVGP